MITVTPTEAAEILAVELLAIGQIVFDGRLTTVNGWKFYRADVEKLKEDTRYLNSLGR